MTAVEEEQITMNTAAQTAAVRIGATRGRKAVAAENKGRKWMRLASLEVLA